MDRRTFVAGVGVSMAGFAGCSGGTEEVEGGDHNSANSGGGSTSEPTNEPTMTETDTPTATSTPEASPSVSIQGSEFKVEEGSYQTEAFAVVTLTNDGSGTSGEVRTKVRFYDDQENLVDDTTISLPYLKPGERWEAKVPYLGDGAEVSSHKVDGEFESEPPLLNPEKTSITDTDMTMDDYGAAVTGVMVNEYEEDISYVAAHARFWREDTILGGGLDNQTELPAGENWSFESSWMGYSDWYENADDFDIAVEVSDY